MLLLFFSVENTKKFQNINAQNNGVNIILFFFRFVEMLEKCKASTRRRLRKTNKFNIGLLIPVLHYAIGIIDVKIIYF